MPTEKLKDAGLQVPKPVQHPLHPAAAPPHAAPGLLAGHGLFSLPGSSAATALLLQRTNEEEKWLARQRRLRQEKEDRQSQVAIVKDMTGRNRAAQLAIVKQMSRQ